MKSGLSKNAKQNLYAWRGELEMELDKCEKVFPVEPISYLDCSNAMLKMWMDNVVTDGEYNRIMDKLNKKT